MLGRRKHATLLLSPSKYAPPCPYRKLSPSCPGTLEHLTHYETGERILPDRYTGQIQATCEFCGELFLGTSLRNISKIKLFESDKINWQIKAIQKGLVVPPPKKHFWRRKPWVHDSGLNGNFRRRRSKLVKLWGMLSGKAKSSITR